MARESTTQYAILGALTIGSAPMSGYDISSMMKYTQGFWSESEGQIYPTLDKMRRLGWIDCVDEVMTGRRKKKVYAITDSGLDTLQRWLSAPAKSPVIRHETLLKLFFGKSVSVEDNAQHLLQILMNAKNVVRECSGHLDSMSLDEQASLEDKLGYIVASYGAVMMQAQVDWAKNSLKLLMFED